MIERLFAKRTNLPIVYQAENAECGLACIAMIASYHGHRIDITTMRQQHPIAASGATLRSVMDICHSMQLNTRALKLEMENLRELTVPAILHWDMDHFVVLHKVTANKITIHDPAVGLRTYSIQDAGKHFTGVALELTPGKEFKSANAAQINQISDLFSRSRSFWVVVAQIFLLSMLVQILALAAPFQIQFVVDNGLARGDSSLITTIALAFVLIVFSQAIVTYLRGLLTIYFSTQVGFQMVANVFHHLIRLPVDFFERRHIGDIVSRFGSTNHIQKLITQDAITVIVDGLFSVTTLILLFIYSPLLATITIAIILCYSVVRFLLLNMERSYNQEVLVAEASQQTLLMENIRSILVTKIYGNERHRAQLWQNNYADFVNTGIILARFMLLVVTSTTLVFALANIAIIYVGANLVLEGELTIGQLMGYIFLKNHFFASVNTMLPKLIELRLIRLQLERLADITFTEPEFEDLEPSPFRLPMTGRLAMNKVSYRYPGYDSDVIQDLSFEINAQDVIAITGPSGCGKSTLLKLLIGVTQPTSGTIMVDEKTLSEYGVRNFRTNISAVLHSDALLAGSIMYNIMLDDHSLDAALFEKVTKLVEIRDDVLQLPMGFNTVVGDLGNSLSAGQVQRLLLARAIYRQPKILFLDEALSNLGNDLAIRVLESIKAMGTTVVLVTHNPKLAELAERQISLEPVQRKLDE